MPVVLQIKNWNALERGQFTDWAARQIVVDYLSQVRADPELIGQVAGWITGGEILLVLDAFDELPSDLQSKAYNDLRQALRAKSFILSCRLETYAELLQTDGPLQDTIAVELELVSPEEAANHLIQVAPAKWRTVARAIRAAPGGEVAKALSAPLNIWAASTASTSEQFHPDDLLKLGLSRNAIQALLFEGVVAALYPGPESAVIRISRTLTFLAASTSAAHPPRGSDCESLRGNIQWWNLYRLCNRTSFALTAFLGVMLAAVAPALAGAALTIGLSPETMKPLFGALCVGALATVLAVLLVDPPPPGRIVMRKRTWRERLLVIASNSWTGLAGGATVGLASAVAFGFLQGLRSGLTIGAITGTVTLLGIYSVVALNGPVSEGESVSPRSSIRDDRRVFLVTGSVLSTLLTLTFAWLGTFPVALLAGIINGFIAAMGISTYGWYTLARVTLALHQKIPWHIVEFLDDAYDRGVLRQSGPTYTFRHIALEEYFAALGEKIGEWSKTPR